MKSSNSIHVILSGLKMVLAALCVLLFIGVGPAQAQYNSPSDIPAEEFARLPTVSSMKFSPSGEYLAMLRPYQGRNVLVVDKRIPDQSSKTGILQSPEPYSIAWVE